MARRPHIDEAVAVLSERDRIGIFARAAPTAPESCRIDGAVPRTREHALLVQTSIGVVSARRALVTRWNKQVGPLGGPLCVSRPDGGLRYVDVWSSEQQRTAAFEQRIHPAVASALAGVRPEQEPAVRRPGLVHASGAVVVVVVVELT